jgi:hypothetical protein
MPFNYFRDVHGIFVSFKVIENVLTTSHACEAMGHRIVKL